MLMRRTTHPGNKLFRIDKNWVYGYVLLLCFACWVGAYMVSMGIPVMEEGTPLWKSTQSLLSGKTAIYVVGIMTMMICAGVVLRTSHRMFMMREQTLLPLVICILLLTTRECFIPLGPGGIGALCLAISICTLLSSYHNMESAKEAYLAGFIVGIGSLFWGCMLWFFPLIWIVLYRFLSLTGKTFAASLLGIGSVYWMVWGVCIVIGNYDLLLQPLTALLDIHPFSLRGMRWTEWCSIGCCILFSTVAVVCTIRRRLGENRRTQSFYLFLLQYAILILLLPSLYPSPTAQEILQCLCIPAAIFLADFFTIDRERWKFWAFHIMVVLLFFFLFIRIVELWNLS
ncbi:MAG: hypothetical protein LBU03_06220 [Tannerellaceae bacterium]|nr:hypothetical protein [Tannerellaceae bacterium]